MIVDVPSQYYPASLPKDGQLPNHRDPRLRRLVPALICRQTKQRGPEICSGRRPAGQPRCHLLCIRTFWVCLRWIRVNTSVGAFSRGCGSYLPNHHCAANEMATKLSPSVRQDGYLSIPVSTPRFPGNSGARVRGGRAELNLCAMKRVDLGPLAIFPGLYRGGRVVGSDQAAGHDLR